AHGIIETRSQRRSDAYAGDRLVPADDTWLRPGLALAGRRGLCSPPAPLGGTCHPPRPTASHDRFSPFRRPPSAPSSLALPPTRSVGRAPSSCGGAGERVKPCV